MKKGKLFVIIVTMMPALVFAQDITVDQILNKMEEADKNVTSLEFEFKQGIIYNLTNEKQTNNGRVSYLKPNYIRVRQQSPLEQEIISNGKKVWIYTPKYRQVIIDNWKKWISNSFMPASIINFGQSFKELKAKYVISYEGRDGDNYVMLFKPVRDDSLKMKFWIDSASFIPVKLVILGDNVTIQTEMFKKSVNPSLDKKIFVFQVPAGVETMTLPSSLTKEAGKPAGRPYHMESIGKLLKEKREAKRLTFSAINSSTRIPLNYLAAIEEDNVSGFPAEVYYLGSLRRYARFLGFDDNALVDAYKQEKTNNEKAVIPSEQKIHKKSSVKFWLIFFFSVAAFALGAYIWLDVTLRNIPGYVPHANPPQIPIEKKVQPNKAQKETYSRPLAPATKPNIPPNVKSLKLEIKAVDAAWIKVTSDGKVEFSTILEKGAAKEWYANKEFNLVVGYAPGVSVKLNGKEIDTRKTAKQDVSELTLTAEDAK